MAETDRSLSERPLFAAKIERFELQRTIGSVRFYGHDAVWMPGVHLDLGRNECNPPFEAMGRRGFGPLG